MKPFLPKDRLFPIGLRKSSLGRRIERRMSRIRFLGTAPLGFARRAAPTIARVQPLVARTTLGEGAHVRLRRAAGSPVRSTYPDASASRPLVWTLAQRPIEPQAKAPGVGLRGLRRARPAAAIPTASGGTPPLQPAGTAAPKPSPAAHPVRPVQRAAPARDGERMTGRQLAPASGREALPGDPGSEVQRAPAPPIAAHKRIARAEPLVSPAPLPLSSRSTQGRREGGRSGEAALRAESSPLSPSPRPGSAERAPTAPARDPLPRRLLRGLADLARPLLARKPARAEAEIGQPGRPSKRAKSRADGGPAEAEALPGTAPARPERRAPRLTLRRPPPEGAQAPEEAPSVAPARLPPEQGQPSIARRLVEVAAGRRRVFRRREGLPAARPIALTTPWGSPQTAPMGTTRGRERAPTETAADPFVVWSTPRSRSLPLAPSGGPVGAGDLTVSAASGPTAPRTSAPPFSPMGSRLAAVEPGLLGQGLVVQMAAATSSASETSSTAQAQAGATAEAPGEPSGAEVDPEALARQVYQILRRRLLVERERALGRPAGRGYGR